MNEAFLPSVRHHDDLIETTATHQIVSDAHGALDFVYAWSAEEAKRSSQSFKKIASHQVEPTIHVRGEFIPHYEHDES